MEVISFIKIMFRQQTENLNKRKITKEERSSGVIEHFIILQKQEGKS